MTKPSLLLGIVFAEGDRTQLQPIFYSMYDVQNRDHSVKRFDSSLGRISWVVDFYSLYRSHCIFFTKISPAWNLTFFSAVSNTLPLTTMGLI